jgi:adenylate kinase
MRIIITGTPGTGKTTMARLLAGYLDYPLIDLKEFINERGMFAKKGNEKIVNMSRLRKSLPSFLKKKKHFVLEGHIACELKLPADTIFITRTKPSTLKRRLGKRNYSAKKIEENVMAELLDYCTQKVNEKYGVRPLELETSGRSRRTCLNMMLGAIKNKKKKLDVINYSNQLKKHLGLRK